MTEPQGVPTGLEEQFRLSRVQTFNWGTFDGVTDIPIPTAGYLFVGPSGSGKSTLLDAHTALLTPPKWVDFNVAAREAERTGRDRSIVSYVRGAWAKQTGDSGEHVVQYLRTGTTWSAIAETYRNRQGGIVVLAQVLWLRGRSSAPTDVQKLYLILQREFDVRELEFFAKHDFDVRRLKRELEGAFVREEFSAYQERFRNFVGIESELALRLLHKTQSAKNLGDLNSFLREFMLDPPETFATAERLVTEFAELSAAHQAVVTAGRQIETLKPARADYEHHELCRAQKFALDNLLEGLDDFESRLRRDLLVKRVEELMVEIEGARQELNHLSLASEDEFRRLSSLKAKREGISGSLVHLERELEGARNDLPGREHRRAQTQAACKALGWEIPDGAPAMVRTAAQAKERIELDATLSADLERDRDGLKEKLQLVGKEFGEVRAEIEAMERQPSNIPAHMLDLRARITDELGLEERDLPFAGELLEVKTDALSWQGAIERVLHGFALSVLVPDRHYPAVSSHVNSHFLGQRLVYNRVLVPGRAVNNPRPNSLIRKLTVAQAPEAGWLHEELCQRFDYECTDTLQAFRSATRAVTKEGQVKHGHSRHEKNDLHAVNDRRRWVLGFENREKLKLYKTRAGELGADLANLQQQLADMRLQANEQRSTLLHCQTLSNVNWAEIDVASLSARIGSLVQQIAAERSALPQLTELDRQIEAQEAAHTSARQAATTEEVRKKSLEEECTRHERAIATLPDKPDAISLTSVQLSGLEERFARSNRTPTLESLDSLTREVERSIREDQKQRELRMTELRNAIQQRFAEFNRNWPAESGGLDPVLPSSPDYFTKLARLETDGLPRYEEHFMKLLREQSDQNLTMLSTRLDLERDAIRDRLELVNESLLTAPFDTGTHLEIETRDRLLEDVRQFKQALKEALSQSFSAEREVAEKRFAVLSALVKRLSSQDGTDKHWRNLVLDVRQHVEFVARELDANNAEVEIYGSGAGKSGGQRQKLAATCLAAALRYQLGGQDRALPSFATVALDEAFDKADAEFTTMAMNIFKTFGFQMIVATPLKSVMTLEPFIGGACFVHIRERKHSAILLIEYDEDARRLKLPEHLPDGQDAVVS